MSTKKSQLETISIRNLGVIESAQVDFDPGLTVITGETGAGKTMVLTALGLIMGSKSDSDFVRMNTDRTAVSASFNLTDKDVSRIDALGISIEDDTLVVSRTVTKEGKSRISIGGELSTTSKVQEVTDELLEIHGQSTSLRLNKPQVQREILDSFANNHTERENFVHIFEQYVDLEKRIKNLKSEAATAESQIATLKEFTSEFAKVMPREGERQEIENEISRLGSVEAIHTQLSIALNLLENDENGTLQNLKTSKKALDSLIGKDSDLDSHIEKFADLIFSVEDVASELVSYLARLEADPARFDYLQERKASINKLIKKFGIGSDPEIAFNQLIVDYLNAENRIADLSGGSERIAELESDLLSLFSDLQRSARSLSVTRERAAVELSSRVSAELAALSMPNARVEVKVQTSEGKKFSEFSLHGLDEILFLFSPHTGASLLPLAKIASGGEVSRLMLAIEVVVASKSPVGTYVFDEVDAGVGGKAAVDIGKRLYLLSQHAQVIVVTHLPQVAVWAHQHLRVQKDQSGSITESTVVALTESERLKEIARMLAGQEESEIAQKHAEELVKTVKEFVIS